MDDEKELIRRIVAGETDLYAVLAERYGRIVYILIARIVGSPQDAEELAQDTFVKAFSKLGRFDGRSAFSTWLFRIACNTAISYARRKKPRLQSIDETRLAALPDDADDALDTADVRGERLDALVRALDRLDPEERALVQLFYYENCSVAQCAQVLKLTEDNVKVRLHRIRKKLCLLITDYETER